jgi:excisionase family DNA binding protein
MSEGTILVVSAGLTRREVLQQARDRLIAQRGVSLLGLVVNRIKPRNGYYDARLVLASRKSGQRSRSGDGTRLTLGEAAEHLGISKDQARRWCKSGRLPATRRGLSWQIDASRLERIQDDMGEIGAQRKE